MIELINVQKRYGARLALDVPELSIQPFERCALIGPNGSGKSTLLRVLAGALAPDAGERRLNGLSQSEIGYLPQTPYAFNLRVLQNVRLTLDGGAAANARAMDALERLGIAHLSNANAKRLSGGETQRMALARLLAKRWKLLLLDEPTSAADVRAVEIVEQALLAYTRETGCAIVYATHAPSQAMRLGERVLALSDGRIAESGEASRVLRAPQAESTRAFLKNWTI